MRRCSTFSNPAMSSRFNETVLTPPLQTPVSSIPIVPVYRDGAHSSAPKPYPPLHRPSLTKRSSLLHSKTVSSASAMSSRFYETVLTPRPPLHSPLLSPLQPFRPGLMRRCSLLRFQVHFSSCQVCRSSADTPLTPSTPPLSKCTSGQSIENGISPPRPFVRSTPGQTQIDRRSSSIRAFRAAGGGRAVCFGRRCAKCSVTSCTNCVNCSGDGSGTEVCANCASGDSSGGSCTTTSYLRDCAKCSVTSRINSVNCSGESRGVGVRDGRTGGGVCNGAGGGGGGGGSDGGGDRARGAGDGVNIGAPARA
ncbi:hypothetical protein BDD12DRAFT_466077 [Trichophaea hybrida]|nr:hypothetical protein BDD12DRAFT_466077 [Trichophaea hybrida]